ncbi:hypothetical protein [Pseudomonas sp. zfem003]|uniref:hypothetical protein n=1 Tax=Pseudomonas sp. zfem003 TaxID=3078198 RepID=UPI0029275F2D|nr:hypothetical protein [Pseudomonas sp. zfem003]MDU9398036.1 hypothetical protein [Pseudomonas sp. zfem003]
MFRLKQLFMQEEGGDAGNQGGGQGPEITPEVQALIEAQVSAAVGGLKAKNGELLGKLKEQGERLKSFEGIDPDAVRGILTKFANDEEAALIAKGDIDTVMNRRAERMKAGYDRDLQTAREEAQRAATRTEKFASRVLKGEVVAAATEAGVHRYAIEDAMLAASRDFELDDEGNPIAREGKFGRDGKPLTLKEWFADMKENRPHWFPSTGSGSGAGHGAGNGRKTISQAEFDALSPKDRAAKMAAGFTVTG